MAFTHSLLASTTVGSGGASTIDFTNIPQNYTDLVLKISGRLNYAATAVGIQFGFNGQAAGTSITGKTIQGSGSSAGSYSAWQPNIDSASATANTFGSVDIYIPNYTSSNNKSASSNSVQEDNSSTAYAEMHAALWSNTSAINRITITPNSGSFVQYSTAYLYGIRAGEY
jgi:hypothetical protein